MDSLSQITLGAAVGEAVLGHKVGNKAMVWGAIAGTIPDLDILFFPFIDAISELYFHRGLSHSFFFITLLTPLLAWLVFKFYKKKEASYKGWFCLFWLAMITHPILDLFTTYGTQIWLPFSDYRASFSSIFVADPLYTMPFLLCVIIAAFYHRSNQHRRWINYLGISLSCLYLGWTVLNKMHVEEQFKDGLAAQNIEYKIDRLITGPTPLNNIMWYGVAESEEGYHFALYSLFDDDKPSEFIFLPRNESLITKTENSRTIQALKWFSKGYYVVQEEDGVLYFNDARFGLLTWDDDQSAKFPFRFKLMRAGDDYDVEILRGPDGDMSLGQLLDDFWSRLNGNK